jgi:hypothetical protein
MRTTSPLSGIILASLFSTGCDLPKVPGQSAPVSAGSGSSGNLTSAPKVVGKSELLPRDYFALSAPSEPGTPTYFKDRLSTEARRSLDKLLCIAAAEESSPRPFHLELGHFLSGPTREADRVSLTLHLEERLQALKGSLPDTDISVTTTLPPRASPERGEVTSGTFTTSELSEAFRPDELGYIDIPLKHLRPLAEGQGSTLLETLQRSGLVLHRLDNKIFALHEPQIFFDKISLVRSDSKGATFLAEYSQSLLHSPLCRIDIPARTLLRGAGVITITFPEERNRTLKVYISSKDDKAE